MRFRSFSEIVFPFRRGWSRLYSACISPACVLKNYVNEEKKFSFSVASFSHFYYLRVSCFARSFFIYELPPVVLHFPRRCPFSCLPLSTTFAPPCPPFLLLVLFVPRNGARRISIPLAVPFSRASETKFFRFSRFFFPNGFQPLCSPSIPTCLHPCHFSVNYPPKRFAAAKIRRTNPIYPISSRM